MEKETDAERRDFGQSDHIGFVTLASMLRVCQEESDTIDTNDGL
jgi:hypothetical protein